MSKRIWSGTVVAFACAVTVGLGAQAPVPSGPSAQNPTSPAAADRMTFTGCIEAGAARPVGTTGSAGATGSDAKFMLTNAMSNKPAAGSAEGASSSSLAARTFRLDGRESDLTARVGQKVEITGTVDNGHATPSSSAAPSTGTPVAQGGSSSTATTPQSGSSASMPAPSTSTASAPLLKVDSIRMIAATCMQ